MVPQELFPPRSPWQTTLYVLPCRHPQAESTASNAKLVLLQRPDDGVVALGHNLWLPLRLVTTPAEREILGPARRGD